MMKRINWILLLLSIVTIIACEKKSGDMAVNDSPESSGNTPKKTEKPYGNPAAPNFNATGSDPKAIEIADSVMAAMGGRENWDKTRYIKWTFFGRRTIIWDKHEQRARIDSKKGLTVLLNFKTGQGKVSLKGEIQNNADSVKKYAKQGDQIWVNDSYWLFMPFKLKDSGVTLKYVGEDSTSHTLQLTFEKVGFTPENKYHVKVDKATNLVNSWAYFPKFEDTEPQFETPWINYKKHGNILLSGDRGEYKLDDIVVYEHLPDEVFEKLEKPAL